MSRESKGAPSSEGSNEPIAVCTCIVLLRERVARRGIGAIL